MSIEEKFRAAVNVIRSLPKNGSYQPSHDLMLRFYAYFKQASEGPCRQSRPSFWEVVKKMKWDAWNKLGNMSREEAMEAYVGELTKIVETMSYTDNVASFMGSLGNFYESVPMEDLELLLGNVIERVRSQPGSPLSSSPFGSREASPQRVVEGAGHGGRRVASSLETSPASSSSGSPQPPGGDDEDDDDDEEFIDTVETAPEKTVSSKKAPLTNGVALTNGHATAVHEEVAERGRSRHHVKHSKEVPRETTLNFPTSAEHYRSTRTDFTEQIRETVLNLQRDLDRVTSRVRSLEVSAISDTAAWPQQPARRHTWWPFADLSPRTTTFLILWPFVVHLALAYVQRRRNARLS